MTNSWQNQQEDTGLQIHYLSPEQKSVCDNGVKEKTNGKKTYFLQLNTDKYFPFPGVVFLEMAAVIKAAVIKAALGKKLL